MDHKLNNSKAPSDIDPLFLSRLKDLGGSKLATELVGMYLIRGAQLLDNISAGIDTQDYTSIKNAAHSLISSAGNLGGKKVSELAKQIENTANEQQSAELPGLLSSIASAHDDFQHYLNGALGEL